eukprot:CAMPEP_0170364496 /NCGR_PEP_ID=MMETSP0117_2-20130122/5403_1 /TAXON_ID=400756 /ORGANISM="Durinskia baltica, Strain CSIRO CS-38" /LENGTH=473 /DNA_ID=CAMNT_0010618997 /DNA_START=68 /DNA_END=1486 /DNA_ORIENTATION=+
MDIENNQLLKNPLDFVLQLTCTDLDCYGESFQWEDGLLKIRKSHLRKVDADNIREFSSTAASEFYARDQGLVGLASTEASYQIREIKPLTEDPYHFDSGGSRLQKSSALFHTAITIPLRSLPWNSDTENVALKLSHFGSCLRYRPTTLIGVVVLYLEQAPKLRFELCHYLDTIVRCASPLIELLCERSNYLRLVDKGGNKYRRLRRAILARIRSKKQSNVALPVPDEASGAESDNCTIDMQQAEGEGGADQRALDATRNSKYQSLSIDLALSNKDIMDSQTKEPTQLELLMQAQLTYAFGYLRKWLGGEVNMPARIDVRFSYAAFVGCFVTIAVWQVMSDGINQIFTYHGVKNPMTLPTSFGALCTIVFALPAAPLAQPRIIILAHTWAMSVAVALTFIFNPYHHIWLQKALAVGITVSGMAKFGILNPPAGAVSLAMLTYANSASYSDHGLLFLIVSTYLGCAVCIVVGMVW